MKRFLCFIIAIITLSLVFTSCDSNKNGDETKSGLPDELIGHVAPTADDIDMSTVDTLDGVTETDEVTDYVLINVENYGQMLIRLYPDVAPLTVANFKALVSEKFYDGLIFHRVIKNFVIQGGDPLGNGTGGSENTVFGEFTNNGFENNLSHKRGVVAMARSTENSASSQFYICHKDSGVAQLDGDYATFGYVVYGIDVVDKIAKVKVNDNDKPLKDVVITSVRFAKLP